MRDELKLWKFIPACSFQVPSAQIDEAAKGQSRRLWRWLIDELLQRPKNDASSESTQRELPSDDQLESVVLEPDWNQPAEALAADLSGWFDKSRSDHGAVRTLVGPPGSGVASVLHALAGVRQFKILLAPPPNAELSAFESDKLAQQSVDESEDEVLVIPHLERYFLRHEDGLNLVRNLTERLMTRGRVLLGCDSWAWAFLQQAIGIQDVLGKPMTLAPFDAERLDAWFRASDDFHDSEFRRSDSNELVFPERSGKSESEQEQPQTSALIKSLSARARGNLGVALALWHSSLLKYDPNAEESAPAERGARPIYWVVPPAELELPQLSNGMDQLHRFILHALLLHAGLPMSTLITLLPFPREEVCCRVSELRIAGVLHEENEVLCVARTAYPEVRRDLVGEGFLADEF